MNIIIALIMLSVIVAMHEFGHFIIAKARGITVKEFSIGMGPRLFSFERGGTRYSLKLLPIGGSCAMGEDEVAGDNDLNAFNNKGVWSRIAVIFAGPLFNFILAFIFALIVIGIVGYDPAYVLSVSPNQAAESAGLEPGDLITSINGKKIVIGRELATYFAFHELDGTQITIEYNHYENYGEDNEVVTKELITYTPVYRKEYMLGFYYNGTTTSGKAVISDIIEGYPMEAAGLKAEDVITAIDGTAINTASELSQYLSDHPLFDQPIHLTYERNGVAETVEITPLFVSEGYSLGFSYNYNYREKTNLFGVIKYSFYEVKYWIVSTVGSLGKLITGQLSTNDIGGPVRIVDEIGNVVEESKDDGTLYVILNLLNWCILLSANLGVMNLLPIPALDGGRLLFLFLEVVRGKPIDKEKEGMVHLVGIVLLMILMAFIFFNDIKNIFFN